MGGEKLQIAPQNDVRSEPDMGLGNRAFDERAQQKLKRFFSLAAAEKHPVA